MVPWATFPDTAFAVVAGELTLRASSPGVTRGHCARCGSHVTYANAARPGEIDVTVATFEDPTALVPTSHIWTEDKLPWVRIADGLPQYRRTASEPDAATVMLHRPVSDDEWAAYHDIRRRILFENRGRFGVYDPQHPDEHGAGNFPLLLETSDGFVGVIRIDVRGDVALLRRVAIDSPWQRRGLGRQLLDLAEAFAREHGAQRVESAVAPDAVPFYEKCGYHRVHGAAPTDESVRMAKEL